MAYKVIILYRLYMPFYFLGTFTEYPFLCPIPTHLYIIQNHKNLILIYLHFSNVHLKTFSLSLKSTTFAALFTMYS